MVDEGDQVTDDPDDFPRMAIEPIPGTLADIVSRLDRMEAQLASTHGVTVQTKEVLDYCAAQIQRALIGLGPLLSGGGPGKILTMATKMMGRKEDENNG